MNSRQRRVRLRKISAYNKVRLEKSLELLGDRVDLLVIVDPEYRDIGAWWGWAHNKRTGNVFAVSSNDEIDLLSRNTNISEAGLAAIKAALKQG